LCRDEEITFLRKFDPQHSLEDEWDKAVTAVDERVAGAESRRSPGVQGESRERAAASILIAKAWESLELGFSFMERGANERTGGGWGKSQIHVGLNVHEECKRTKQGGHFEELL